jgi:hypothetical protein
MSSNRLTIFKINPTDGAFISESHVHNVSDFFTITQEQNLKYIVCNNAVEKGTIIVLQFEKKGEIEPFVSKHTIGLEVNARLSKNYSCSILISFDRRLWNCQAQESTHSNSLKMRRTLS